jgi:surface antigen
MDEKDRMMAEQAVHKAAQGTVGEKIIWSNEKTGNSGSAKTIKIGTDKDGHACRQIEQELTIDGKTEVVIIHVCQLNDGHWVVAP